MALEHRNVSSFSEFQEQAKRKAAEISATETVTEQDLALLRQDLDSLQRLTVDVKRVTADIIKEESEVNELVDTLSNSALDAHKASTTSELLLQQVNKIMNSPDEEVSPHKKNQFSKRLMRVFRSFNFADKLSRDAKRAIQKFNVVIRDVKTGNARVELEIEEVQLEAVDLLKNLETHRASLGQHYNFEDGS